MEKKIIIDFLNEHWDEFATLIPETPDAAVNCTLTECFPNDLCEFARLLSKMMAIQPMQTADKPKGLLEKARQFRKKIFLNDGKEYASIIVKNGLFTVQPQQHGKTLDSSFQNLVDSVL